MLNRNHRPAANQQLATGLSPRAKKQNYAITSDANDFVNAKSHAREKPLVAGCQSIPYDLITKDIFGIIK